MRRAAIFWALSLVAGCASGEVANENDAGGGSIDLGGLPPPPTDSGSPTDTGPRPDAGPGADLGSTTPPPPPDAGGTTPPPPPRDMGTSTPCGSMDCATLDTQCTYGACVDDRCVEMPRDEGTPCDDFDPCTTGDACSAGECNDGTPLDCSAMTSECGVGMCNPATSACFVMPQNEGEECPGEETECGSWACRAGVCSAVAAADGTACAGPAMPCVSYTCSAGSCSASPAGDCAPCGTAGSYCAGGSCGASPTTLAYGFETGMPSGWTTTGDANWFRAMGTAHSGSWRAESGDISADQSTSLNATITLASAATLSFWLSTSTESCCDHLELFVDGVEVGQWSGTTSTQAMFPLAAGTHTLEWRYSKDDSVNAGSDSVWIDDVTIGPGSPFEGFEGGVLPSGFTVGGTAAWSIVSTGARTGTYAMGSGTIGSSSTSSLYRAVTLSAAGNVRFAYRVSSEATYDELSFWIDGVMQNEWSGDVAWTTASYSLSAGAHMLEWRYTKDASLTGGSDRAWIDDVEVGDPMPGAPLCGP